MKKRISALFLSLALLCALAFPTSAFNMGKAGKNNVVSICDHTGFIDKSSSLWMWGDNTWGGLGNGGGSNSINGEGHTVQTIPVKVIDNVSLVSCGDAYTAIIKTDGSLWMWGLNSLGELGNGEICNGMGDGYKYQTVPVKVMGNVAAVNCGEAHTAAIKTDNSLWMWGLNDCGQLGNGGGSNSSPTYDSSFPDDWPLQNVPVKVLDNVVAVSCGYRHTAAIKTNGSLWMWGHNDDGQLGNGGGSNAKDTHGDPCQTVPVKVMDNVAAVSCGENHTAAIKTDGSLWMWGLNDCGQLGNSSITNSSTPIKVLDNVAAVSCGSGHTVAIKTDGSLWAWGNNSYGQLGNGGGGNAKTAWGVIYQTVPVKVMDNTATVACGYDTTAVVKSDGTLWTWGSNYRNPLGYESGNATSGSTPIQTIPKQVAGLTAKVPAKEPTPSKSETAMPTNDKLTVNGKLQNPTVYKINGNNYFKIRDLAAVLNGTGSQFNVGYDNALKSVTVTTGKGYAKQPGDLAGAATGGNQTATPSNDAIYINGKKVTATAYKIGGSNYFKLRDLNEAIGFTIDWSADKGVSIQTK